MESDSYGLKKNWVIDAWRCILSVVLKPLVSRSSYVMRKPWIWGNQYCPAQTVDPRFPQTIYGLSQAQYDQFNTYSKLQRLQCRIPYPKYESLTSPCEADRSPSLRLRISALVCGA